MFDTLDPKFFESHCGVPVVGIAKRQDPELPFVVLFADGQIRNVTKDGKTLPPPYPFGHLASPYDVVKRTWRRSPISLGAEIVGLLHKMEALVKQSNRNDVQELLPWINNRISHLQQVLNNENTSR